LKSLRRISSLVLLSSFILGLYKGLLFITNNRLKL